MMGEWSEINWGDGTTKTPEPYAYYPVTTRPMPFVRDSQEVWDEWDRENDKGQLHATKVNTVAD